MYVGSQPPTASYTWTSTCGTFTNPNQQNPGNHCFLTIGLCTLQVIIVQLGQAPDTCYAFVEVNPIPDGTIEHDTMICPGDCAFLIVYFFSGTPPFVYQVDDGFNSNIYTSSGFSDTIIVCPPVTTTYTLAAITSGGNCQSSGPFNSATVTVLPGVTASVTQTGNMLCANPPNQNYQWWDCAFNQLQATTQCITLTQNSCFCLIVISGPPGACADTVCAEYFLPCDLTCDIIFNDSICIGDSVIFAYSGNASANATFNWIIDLPGFPSAHFFGNDTVILVYDQQGCYDVSLTVTDGPCTSNCSDSLCVFSPSSEATLGPDVTACDTCAIINISLFGLPPWTIIMSDGVTYDTITGVAFSPYPYVVCPPQDTSFTYILIEVTDAVGVCPAVIGNDSTTVTLFSSPIATITQTGNLLCADTINGSYAWYDCGFNTLLSTSPCLTILQSGCYCLIVSNGVCHDTLCGDYLFTPCELSCEVIAPDNVCLGDTVIFAYSGNASVNATFNWVIDLEGFPGAHFVGNDTVILIYNLPGCYHAYVTVMDGGCTVTCGDTVCVGGPHSEASICCDEEKCDSCTTITISLFGAAPWTVYLSDGTNIDTIAGIISSPYLHTVCPPGDSTITYTIQVIDSFNLCPAIIFGDSTATITLHPLPVASIVQNGDTLCANPPNMAGYGWYPCPAGGYLSTSQCFSPPTSGCYCVDVSTSFDCVDTACFNFIISAVDPVEEGNLSIYPIPSTGVWEISFSNKIHLPVQWFLYDVWGRKHESGILQHHSATIHLKQVPPTGFYYLRFETIDHQTMMVKVLIQ